MQVGKLSTWLQSSLPNSSLRCRATFAEALIFWWKRFLQKLKWVQVRLAVHSFYLAAACKLFRAEKVQKDSRKMVLIWQKRARGLCLRSNFWAFVGAYALFLPSWNSAKFCKHLSPLWYRYNSYKTNIYIIYVIVCRRLATIFYPIFFLKNYLTWWSYAWKFFMAWKLLIYDSSCRAIWRNLNIVLIGYLN